MTNVIVLQGLSLGGVGVIDFTRGVLKTFRSRTFFTCWKVIGPVPKELQSDTLHRSYRVCAEGDGKVYVLQTKDMILYCLDVTSRRWGNGLPVDTTYRSQAACMVYCKGRLYISGGRALNGDETYSIMLSLAIKTGMSPISVQQEQPMAYARCEHQMACVDGEVLVCGGRSGHSALATCEVFEPSTRTWAELIRNPKACSAPGLVSTGDGVYVLGGVKQDISIPGCRFYRLSDTVSFNDLPTRQWISSTKLPLLLGYVQAIYKNESLWVLAAVVSIYKTALSKPGTYHMTYLRNILEYNVTQQTWIKHNVIPGNDVFLFRI